MSSNFVPNLAFMPQLEQAVLKAMQETVLRTANDVKRNLTPSQIRSKTSVVTVPAHRIGAGEISGVVKYGRGLGPIFEGGTAQRFTRSGAGRGAITTSNFAMTNARETAIRRGLDLSRYL
jgi:hypothetical protein